MCGDRIHWIGYGLCGESRDDPGFIVLDPLQCNKLCRSEIVEERLKYLKSRRATIRSRGLQLLAQFRHCCANKLVGEKVRSDGNGWNGYVFSLEMAGRDLKESQ